MEENNNALEGFLNILKQQEDRVVENINKTLYDDVCRTAEILDKTKNESERKAIKENLRERFKNIGLNQVTDLFIYNQMFFTTNENPLPTASALCINIGKLFTQENLHYAATKVYSSDEVEGGAALSFLVYLAILENEGTYIHRDYVLNFIKENFNGFSQNKKTECVFQLKNYLSDDKIAQQIISDSGITEYKLVFSTGEDSSSKPITFKFKNEKNDYEKQLISDSKISIQSNKKENINNTEEIKNPKYHWWQFWKK
jgi:hypothetical protein